ncbi:MAG TPA: flippase-like domain-containing protein, partial [Geobacterales bacterium]|nr:flippase-like domain-containing protein [Geobacterales bacterium]
MLKNFIRYMLIALIIILFIIIILSIGPDRLLLVLSKSNWDLAILILLTNFMSILFFFLAWHVLLIRLAKVSFYESFKSTSISIFFNLLIPSFSIGGEYARINYLSKNCGISNEVVLATLSINKFQYGLTMIIFFILGVFTMYAYSLDGTILLPSLIVVGVLTIILYVLILKPHLIKKIVNSILGLIEKSNRFPKEKINLAKTKSDSFIDEFSRYSRFLLKSPSSITALAFMVLQWLFSSLSFYIAFLAVGYKVNLGLLLFTFPFVAALTTSSFLI